MSYPKLHVSANREHAEGLKRCLKREKKEIWGWWQVRRQRKCMWVKDLEMWRRNWTALANGQQKVASFGYWCCLPIIKQMSTCKQQCDDCIWKRDHCYFWRREKRSYLCSGEDCETSTKNIIQDFQNQVPKIRLWSPNLRTEKVADFQECRAARPDSALCSEVRTII